FPRPRPEVPLPPADRGRGIGGLRSGVPRETLGRSLRPPREPFRTEGLAGRLRTAEADLPAAPGRRTSGRGGARGSRGGGAVEGCRSVGKKRTPEGLLESRGRKSA